MDCHQVQSAANCFLTYDYPETKDLLKTSLSLISGLLVFSVTFGDKIFDRGKTSRLARTLLVAAWIGLLLAFITSGAAISLLGLAAGRVLYGDGATELLGYAALANWSWACMLASGIVFVLSLVSLVGAAVAAMYAHDKPVSSET